MIKTSNRYLFPSPSLYFYFSAKAPSSPSILYRASEARHPHPSHRRRIYIGALVTLDDHDESRDQISPVTEKYVALDT